MDNMNKGMQSLWNIFSLHDVATKRIQCWQILRIVTLSFCLRNADSGSRIMTWTGCSFSRFYEPFGNLSKVRLRICLEFDLDISNT